MPRLTFAAAWLYRATGRAEYAQAAQQYWARAVAEQNRFVSWDALLVPAANVMMSLEPDQRTGAGPGPRGRNGTATHTLHPPTDGSLSC